MKSSLCVFLKYNCARHLIYADALWTESAAAAARDKNSDLM